MQQRFDFLRLPLELRDRVYSHYFDPASRLVARQNGGQRYQFDFNIYRACNRLHIEAKRVFRRENLFIRVETPWAQAENHVANEGAVPLVASGKSAEMFTGASFTVLVGTHIPELPAICKIIILLDDLPLFTKMWYYSALGYAELNAHLQLGLQREDPFNGSLVLGKSVQQKFLMPFGCVKLLDEVTIKGFDQSVEKKLREEMAVPYDSPEKCFDNCNRFIVQAEDDMSKEQYHEALSLYHKAFHAIHIIVHGRKRAVLADAFFEVEIKSGQYKGWTGEEVRLVLRLRLVASIIKVYLKLKEWCEAMFWGSRSIDVIESNWGPGRNVEAYKQFSGAHDMGLIYLRTGIAGNLLAEAVRRGEWKGEYPGHGVPDPRRLQRVGCLYLDPEVVERENQAYSVVWLPDTGGLEEASAVSMRLIGFAPGGLRFSDDMDAV